MVDRPLEVLFVSHKANLGGGAQLSLLTLLRNIDRRIIQPTVLVPDHGALADALAEIDIPVIVASYGPWISKRETAIKNLLKGVYHSAVNVLAYRSLRRLLQGRSFDAIYTNTLSTPVGAWLAKAAGCPHIWHAREFVHEGLDAVYDWSARRSMNFIDDTTACIISNSYAVQNRLTRYIPAEKCRVIYNGFPELDSISGRPSRLAPDPHRRLKLGMVGRIGVHKGQIEGVCALHSLVGQYGIDAELWLVGHGDAGYTAQVRQLTDELHLTDRVIWKGFVQDMAEVYRALDIMLVCSRFEAFGRVVVEALAHGCPVVAADSGGVSEIITHGENGLLYPAGDTEALAAQVAKLTRESGLYERIAAAAYASVYPRFSVQRYVQQVSDTILETVEAAQYKVGAV